MPLVGDDGPMRALVDVPEGYFSSGGWFIDDGHGELAPDEFGNLSFWGVVGQVDPDPCQGNELLRPGPNVRDLARALVAQRHRTTSGLTQVTVGGFDELYVESWATGGFEIVDTESTPFSEEPPATRSRSRTRSPAPWTGSGSWMSTVVAW